MNSNEFDSEFASVKYVQEDGAAFLTWKKFCCFDDYRTPTIFALELLRKKQNSNFIVDARNGFEDKKEDVEWGFTFLLPEMSKTGCKKVAFIMDEINDIEGEMDMWTREFMKYFAVKKVKSYKRAAEFCKE